MQKSLTSEPDRFSDEAWNLLTDAEETAQRWRHENLDVEHLIQNLFSNKKYQRYTDALSINHFALEDHLDNFLADLPITQGDDLYIGEALEELLENSEVCRSQWGSKKIEIAHLLLAIGRDSRIGSEMLNMAGLSNEILEREIKRLPIPNSFNAPANQTIYRSKNSQEESNIINKKETKVSSLNAYKQLENKDLKRINESNNNLNLQEIPKALDEFGRDLTEAAGANELDPVIGRDPEIRSIIKVLSRRGKNNPILIGPPGVGKTAIAELLAQQIMQNKVPDSLRNQKIISLDVGALIAGAKFRGQVEERLRAILAEIREADNGIILFIDELHSLVSSDRSNVDAGNLLKPLLANGEIRCIGTTTPESYRKTIEKDQALSRHFQQVTIKEPNLELSLEILKGVKERYEDHHGVTISDRALTTANRLADRYISDRCLPDKAIDLIDEASAQIKISLSSKPQVIEDAELELRRLDLLIADTSQDDTYNLLDKYKKDKEISVQKLAVLKEQWQRELDKYDEMKELLEQYEEIKISISEAENIGDIEEAHRLEYEQLNNLEESIEDLENSISNDKKKGNSLLRNQVEPEDIADVVSRWTGIPVNKVLAGERKKLLELEKDLSKKVIGQQHAVESASAAIRRARAGMQDIRRPIGSFLFLGPTGVGKTELAKTLASSLFDEEEALVRLDMSEFMERNAVARLLGAPPGYVGYEEGGQLTEAVRRRPYAVLLLDEIEKAHPEVFNILLQVLDEGRLTDSQGRTVDFRNTIIVMTSNLASKEILENTRKIETEGGDLSISNKNLNQKIDQALRKAFRPEFLNRIDEVIKFKPLHARDLQQIVRLHLSDLIKLLSEQDLKLHIDSKVIEKLALEGYEPEYGARPLRRVIRKRLENPLATQLLEEAFKGGKAIKVSLANDESQNLIFSIEN